MNKYETAVQELAKVKVERNVALAKVSKDGRRIAELEAVEERLLAERVALTATCEDYRIQACRPDDCNVKKRLEAMTARAEKAEDKLEVGDAMLLEIWGAYNRIGDALKMPEKKASMRGEAT